MKYYNESHTGYVRCNNCFAVVNIIGSSNKNWAAKFDPCKCSSCGFDGTQQIEVTQQEIQTKVDELLISLGVEETTFSGGETYYYQNFKGGN